MKKRKTRRGEEEREQRGRVKCNFIRKKKNPDGPKGRGAVNATSQFSEEENENRMEEKNCDQRFGRSGGLHRDPPLQETNEGKGQGRSVQGSGSLLKGGGGKCWEAPGFPLFLRMEGRLPAPRPRGDDSTSEKGGK